MTAPVTLDGGYFDAMYAESDDPWGFHGIGHDIRRTGENHVESLLVGRERNAVGPGQIVHNAIDFSLGGDVPN